MRLNLSALALGLLAATSVSAAPVQWTAAAGGNDHWYEFVSDAVTAPQAFTAAGARVFQGLTGYLATVTSAEENRFVSVTVADGLLAWLGGSDAGAAQVNDWTWRVGPEAGQAFGFTNWNAGEPNNCCGGEDYLQTNWASVAGWNDHGGPGNAGQTNGYLVEYSAATTHVPEPGGLALVALALAAAGAVRRRAG